MLSSADHLKMLRRAQSVQITLSRGDVTVKLCAVPAKSTGQLVGSDGTLTKFTTNDFLMIADETGSLGQPQRGDLVLVNGRTFTVAHPSEKQPAVELFGGDGLSYRVHTVLE